MAIVLSNLQVKSYRGINELELENFNHVNILVGDNNAGKTSVMEMICALSAPDSLGVWNEIAIKKSDYYRGAQFYSAYNNIFPIDKERRIQFNGDFSKYGTVSVCMTAEEYKTTISERELNRINGFLRTGKQDFEDVFVDTNVLEVHIEVNNNMHDFEIYDFQRRPPRTYKNEVFNNNVEVKTAFIEPRDGLDNDFSYMKNVILDTEYYERLLEVLCEFDSEIMDILSVEDSGKVSYYVRTSNHANAVPVSVYGDGLKKVLLVFATLVANREGIVLIDEIETSIHTSAMKMVFSALIEWSYKLGIQLFVSTHSKEALNVLLNCDEQYQDGINVYTLYRNEQKNYVRRLSCKDALELQNRMGMELR